MLAIIRGVFLLLLLCAGLAQAADTGWMQTPTNTHARVWISAEQQQDSIHALLQIELAPGWKTYWRSPGAGGVPPVIRWDGETRADWFWPLPQRFDISGLSTQEQVTVAGEAATTSPRVQGSLWGMLLMALAGGMILNLMPCVLPVMGMKLATVLNAGANRERIRLRFLLTSAGILTSFAALAALMTGLKLSGLTPGWGTQFQNPWFIGFLAAGAFLFALTLLGLVHLMLPSALNSRLAGAGGQALAGSFWEGAFATLLATPCSAPFLGTAVAWALSASLAEMWLIFLTLGAGMSLPWLLVAALPRLALLLPKPGQWMNALKTLLGLMMFASALWLLSLLTRHTGATAVAVIALVMVLLTLEALLKTHTKNQRGALLLTAVLAAAGGWQIHTLVDPTYVRTEAERGSAVNWQPLSEQALAQARAAGKTVFIDVTADWCITCKVNEFRVLKRPEVIQALNQPDVVALRGDWSQPSQPISDFLQKRHVYAIPFYQVYLPGNDEGQILPTLLDTSSVLNALNKSQQR